MDIKNELKNQLKKSYINFYIGIFVITIIFLAAAIILFATNMPIFAILFIVPLMQSIESLLSDYIYIKKIKKDIKIHE